MSGLIEKDIRLMLKRKNYLVMILAIAVMLSFSMDGTFIISYVTMLGALFTVSTISYDEFDNGYPYLMTLPITPGIYAVEKYVLGFMTGAVTWILAVGLCLISNQIKGIGFEGSEALMAVLTAVPIYLLILSLLIPIELKFGSEKGRIALIVIAGGVVVLAMLGGKLLGVLGIDVDPIISRIENLSTGAVAVGILALIIPMVTISMLCSIAVMRKKEY